mmetsp:Transcript_16722/g.44165  ORF Transcript_16722/g.44165 Transcript_16722/m.44165 type:complete len:286 (+) Transcript_16722:178-1035(+)
MYCRELSRVLPTCTDHLSVHVKYCGARLLRSALWRVPVNTPGPSDHGVGALGDPLLDLWHGLNGRNGSLDARARLERGLRALRIVVEALGRREVQEPGDVGQGDLVAHEEGARAGRQRRLDARDQGRQLLRKVLLQGGRLLLRVLDAPLLLVGVLAVADHLAERVDPRGLDVARAHEAEPLGQEALDGLGLANRHAVHLQGGQQAHRGRELAARLGLVEFLAAHGAEVARRAEADGEAEVLVVLLAGGEQEAARLGDAPPGEVGQLVGRHGDRGTADPGSCGVSS